MKTTLSAHVSGVLRKPRALKRGSRLGVFAPASPGNAEKVQKGILELQALGFEVQEFRAGLADGFFASSADARYQEFSRMATDASLEGMVALRGGYGSNYILQHLQAAELGTAKCLVGFSDLTSLQIFLWQRAGWVTFHGPMVAAGFDAGADAVDGYDRESFLNATQNSRAGWGIDLRGEAMIPGEAEGRILGGCLTLLEATIGTPWEIDTRNSILVLEDRAMKPYQVDRVLMHLKQAGKLVGVRGMVLGEFPECEPPAGTATVRDVCARILGELNIPAVFGSPVGHTKRPMLTLPLGVLGRLSAKDGGGIEILEPAVVE